MTYKNSEQCKATDWISSTDSLVSSLIACGQRGKEGEG